MSNHNALLLKFAKLYRLDNKFKPKFYIIELFYTGKMMKFDDLSIEIFDKNLLKFSGNFTYKSGKKAINFINKFSKTKLSLDFEKLDKIDYAMAILLNQLIQKNNISIINSTPQIDKILSFAKMDANEKISPNFGSNIFSQIGAKCVDMFRDLISLSTFIGEFFIKFVRILINPRHLRIKEISNHINDAGIGAVFIVSLTSFLIGIVLAYIGSDMLSKFGASIYIINIMGIMSLREVGPLIAAIVIAGRSASSFTAQIGVMKITEEIEAMKTMNFDPFIFLSMPRIIAMVIVVPMVIFLADMFNLAGQILVCYSYLDIPVNDYFVRFKDSVSINHLLVGLTKAPFFGAIIAIIGCMRGFEVKQNSQSLGKYTTISVVNAIFWVICIDAFFAILFSKLGV